MGPSCSRPICHVQVRLMALGALIHALHDGHSPCLALVPRQAPVAGAGCCFCRLCCDINTSTVLFCCDNAKEVSSFTLTRGYMELVHCSRLVDRQRGVDAVKNTNPGGPQGRARGQYTPGYTCDDDAM